MPYLGKDFDEIRRTVEQTIRDAIAHITPGLNLRIADYAADIWTCPEGRVGPALYGAGADPRRTLMGAGFGVFREYDCCPALARRAYPRRNAVCFTWLRC
jgi:hypothetical protein